MPTFLFIDVLHAVFVLDSPAWADNRRKIASLSHWNLTTPGYSAGRAYATEVSLSPSFVIAFTADAPQC